LTCLLWSIGRISLGWNSFAADNNAGLCAFIVEVNCKSRHGKDVVGDAVAAEDKASDWQLLVRWREKSWKRFREKERVTRNREGDVG
jgi:hypothetical protein